MEKALEILLMDRSDIANHKIVTTEMFNEAIAELEEAMKHKTCKGCVHEVEDMQDLYCAFCSRSCDDNFEPKDTQ